MQVLLFFSGSFQDTTIEDIEWLFEINFTGAVRLTKALYPYFLEKNDGHIVNISSILEKTT
jgi:short-subunit dehydrogenase